MKMVTYKKTKYMFLERVITEIEDEIKTANSTAKHYLDECTNEDGCIDRDTWEYTQYSEYCDKADCYKKLLEEFEKL